MYTIGQIKKWAQQGQSISPKVVLELISYIEIDRKLTKSKLPFLCTECGDPGEECGFSSNLICTTIVCHKHKHMHKTMTVEEMKAEWLALHAEKQEREDETSSC